MQKDEELKVCGDKTCKREHCKNGHHISKGELQPRGSLVVYMVIVHEDNRRHPECEE